MLSTDSRQYRFAYEICSRSDVPGDFPGALSEDEWLTALFMPGDTDTFWQPPEYSPRIYLLKRDRLLAYSHPASREGLFETPLSSLMAVELQKSLLYGVIQFHTASTAGRFRYSTVHQRLFNRFLQRLRLQWLTSTELEVPVPAIQNAMQHSSARCLRELTEELDPNECLHEQYCQAAIQVKERSWLLRRSRTTPALLIAVTNRRVIAISTGAGERNDQYEMAVRYAPVCGLSSMDIMSGGRDIAILHIRLRDNTIWKFQIPDAHSSSILHLLGAMRNLLSSPRDNELNAPIPE